MDRRQFFSVCGAGAAGMAVSPSLAAAPTRRGRSGAARKPLLMKLGCQSAPTTDEHFAYFARYGVRNICARIPTAEPDRPYATLDEIKRVQDMAAKYGITVDMTQSTLLPSSHIDRERNPAIMLAQDPQRDRDIEAFQKMIRTCGEAGIPSIKYNMSLLGVVRTGHTPGRGDAQYITWNLAEAKPEPPLTRAGVVNADAFWERIDYFLTRVVPVAAENKVRIACHPHDPGMPPQGYQGVDRVLGTIDGLKKFITMHENPYHGLNFCQGTVSENLRHPGVEIFDVIRYFGTRKKIFNVHFRNIRGGRDHFQETFPDDGDVDFVKALQVYREIGYDGMIMPDHVPDVDGHPEAALQSFAFAYGYIRGLMQSAERLT